MKRLTLCLALLFSISIYAQWTTDTAMNTLVVNNNFDDKMSVGTSDGQTYVVFWRMVPAPENFELRVQLLDAAGVQQLGPDGALISDAIPMSSFTVTSTISIDDLDNIYVGVTGTSDSSGHLFKVGLDGMVQWSTVLPTDAFVVSALPLSTGEVLASWLDSQSGKASMQKYDAAGQAVWPAVQTAEAGGSSTSPANAFELANGDVLMIFHQLGIGINSTLFAQRFDTDGNAVWGDATQLSDRTTAYNRTYNAMQDGDVVYIAYHGANAFRFDSFLQRIDPDGGIPWGINGSDFDTSEGNYEMTTNIAMAQGTDNIWAVCNYTDPTQSMYGEYAQKFDKQSGARLLGDQAKEVYAVGSDYIHQGSLRILDELPLFVIQEGLSDVTLHMCQLDDNGDFLWPEELRPLATSQADKSNVELLKPINGQAVAVFVEDRGTGPQIFAQNYGEAVLSIGSDLDDLSLGFVNPVQSDFRLVSNELIQSVEVFNVPGQKIKEETVNATEYTRNWSSWSSGVYLVRLTFTGSQAVKTIKVFKQ